MYCLTAITITRNLKIICICMLKKVIKQICTQEGGWSWLVVLASFFTLLVLDGTCYTFGVFMEPLR
jgi:hypothetical protein